MLLQIIIKKIKTNANRKRIKMKSAEEKKQKRKKSTNIVKKEEKEYIKR